MKISVIVPVYKVEEYIYQCIDSILNQTFDNFELILVDDGSPDKCGIICDEYAKKDKRIVVIHKENGGLSSARNAGIDIAKGEYIAFVDSDDWIAPEYLDFLYKSLIQSHSEISACDIITTSDSKTVPLSSPFQYNTFSPEKALETLISGKVFRAVAWNKLYKKDLLIGESFKVGKYHEDEFFTYRIIHKCNQLSYVDAPLYFYRQRSQSIMHTTSIKHLDSLEAFIERLDLLKSNYPKLYYSDIRSFCVACLILYKESKFIDCSQRYNYKKNIKKYRSKIKIPFKYFLKQSFKNKVLIFGSRFLISLTSKLIKTEK